MRKLPEVEDAKALMTEAMDWSVLRWLWEKQGVRASADEANAALDQLDEKVKARWSDELETAYKELRAESGDARRHRQLQRKQPPQTSDPEVKLLAKRLKEADDEAYRVRMDAENTFDEAERQLNTSLARGGCQEAIDSWELHEKAIRKSEAAAGANKAATQGRASTVVGD